MSIWTCYCSYHRLIHIYITAFSDQCIWILFVFYRKHVIVNKLWSIVNHIWHNALFLNHSFNITTSTNNVSWHQSFILQLCIFLTCGWFIASGLVNIVRHCACCCLCWSSDCLNTHRIVCWALHVQYVWSSCHNQRYCLHLLVLVWIVVNVWSFICHHLFKLSIGRMCLLSTDYLWPSRWAQLTMLRSFHVHLYQYHHVCSCLWLTNVSITR